MMQQLGDEMQEYWRRIIVQLIRDAGTEIRKAEIRRHALTARVNLDRARRVQQALKKDVEMLVPQAELESTIKQLRKLEDAQQVGAALNRLMHSFLAAIPALPFRLQDVITHVQESNSLVEVANKIIADLGRERIYLAVIQTLAVPQDASVLFILPRAYETTSMVVGFFEGLQEAGASPKTG